MVNAILSEEKTKRDLIAKRALNKSPFEKEKFRIKQEQGLHFVDEDALKLLKQKK